MTIEGRIFPGEREPYFGDNKFVSENNKSKKEKLNLDELSLFSYQLSLMLKSGVSYLDAIDLLKIEFEEGKLKRLSDYIYGKVKDGRKLHEALDDSEMFPVYFVQMTKIAEKSGMVDVEMERLSNYYENMEKARYKVRSALVYPAFLFVLTIGVVFLLFIKVFPIFQEVLTSLGGDLPQGVKWVFDFSNTLEKLGIILLVVVLLLLISGFIYSKSSSGREQFDTYKINSRFSKNLYRKLITLRFSQGFLMLVKAGIPYEEALNFTAPLTENVYSAKKIEQASIDLNKGSNLADALEKTEIFPKLFVQMINIGARSGKVDSTLEKLCGIYEKELDRATKRVTDTIEPTLVIILSVIVALILLTVMLPMIQIMSTIG